MTSSIFPAFLRRPRPRAIALLVAAAVAVTYPLGRARADGPRSITLDQAVKLALANNPDSQSASEDLAAAGGALVQARALPNPSLFVSSLGSEIKPFDLQLPNQFGVTWTIPLFGKRGAGIAAARADVDAAHANRVSVRWHLAFDVEKAFISVLVDQAQLDFARQDQNGIDEAVKINELRYKDGKIAYGEVLKLRIQQHAVEDQVRQDQLTLSTDRAELERLTGQVLDVDYVVVGSLTSPAVPDPPGAEALLARALAHRPDYQALLAAERSARSVLDQAERQPLPDLGVLVDYNREPDTAGSFDLQVSVALPIFDRNSGAITQAAASEHKARLASSSLRAQIRADVRVALKSWETSRQRLAVYDQDLLAAAKESLEISTHAYQEGRGTLLDYLDAESSYRDVERGYRAAVADAMLAAATLRFVTGEDLP
jgi:cobalt-zinc-cadmium efflux system outer membrane protein